MDQQLSYSLRRQYVDNFLARTNVAESGPETLLDVGGVKDQQRGKFKPSASGFNVIAVNISTDKGVDLRANAAKLPIKSNHLKWVLCSEVLEHVDEPLRVVAEIFRVLRPGGNAVITVPFLFRLHADPQDIGRYTHWFWRSELEKIGFDQIIIEKQGLFWSVMVDMLREWFRYLVISERFKTKLATDFFSWIVRRFRKSATLFDAKLMYQEHDFFGRYTTGFGIVATKP
jgi:ubiquinone/menaquinone biosynthesis C-methylase UbiE